MHSAEKQATSNEDVQMSLSVCVAVKGGAMPGAGATHDVVHFVSYHIL